METLYHILDNKAEALEFLSSGEFRGGECAAEGSFAEGQSSGGLHQQGWKNYDTWGNDSLQVGDTVIVVTTQKGLRDIRDILKR